MAQYTERYIIVYQAYRPAIGLFAAENQYFGGPFSYSRMSWIKPNFMWMMYRSGWGQKEGQEVVLAIKLKIDYFEEILACAVSSSFDRMIYENELEWNTAKRGANVVLQWDPDHHPSGSKLERRAIQLGLRNELLEPFKGEGILEIEDISDFVRQQRGFVTSKQYSQLMMPEERIYTPNNTDSAKRIGLDVL